MALVDAGKAEPDERKNGSSRPYPLFRSLDVLTELERTQSSPAGCKEISDSDFCVLEDELDSGTPPFPTPFSRSLTNARTRKPEGVYVDLLLNPERFTGYAGPSSSRVWQSIYLENCFSPVPYIDPSRPSWEGGSGYADVSAFTGGGAGGLGGLRMGGWGEGEKRLMGSLAGPKDPTEEVCLEKRVFYRVISGAFPPSRAFFPFETGDWRLEADSVRCGGQVSTRLSRFTFATTTSTNQPVSGCVPPSSPPPSTLH